jgi:hypothetical protein
VKKKGPKSALLLVEEGTGAWEVEEEYRCSKQDGSNTIQNDLVEPNVLPSGWKK